MDNVYHEQEETGVFYGAFSLSEGKFPGAFEAKCSQVCINNILQTKHFADGLAVSMDSVAVSQAIATLDIKTYFGLTEIQEMQNLFLMNWRDGQLEVFGSLLAMFQVLKLKGLNLLPLSASLHPVVFAANAEPESVKGYLYYLDDHWMVLRQLGNTWYKFNPWLGGPQILTHSYVSLYVKQLSADAHLVFLVDGNFPPCPADVIKETIAEETVTEHPGKSSLEMTEEELCESLRMLNSAFEGEDNELALAIYMSMEDNHQKMKELETFYERIGGANASTSSVNEMFQASAPSNTCNQTVYPLDQVNEEIDFLSGNESTVRNNGGGQVKRRNGTTVCPQIIKTTPSANDSFLNCSSDSDDYSTPFRIIYDELGDGTQCNSLPPLNSSVIERNIDLLSQLPSNVPIAQPTIFITSSNVSSFKKVVLANEEVQEPAEQEMCCICWAVEPTHVVVPCGHFCLCADCAENIRKPPPEKYLCPLCKQETNSIIKLFK